MTTKPLVSIALCTHNSGIYLTPLFESLVKQTWDQIEIVCCDDVSTDGTQQVLLKLQQAHPHLLKLHFNETNLGYIKNFEQCLSLCNGAYIAIADHDDVWLPHKIERLMQGIGNDLLVYSDSIHMDSEGNLLPQKISTKHNLLHHPDPRSFAFSNCVWGHTLLMNKQLLQYALPIPPQAPYDIWISFVAASVGFVNYIDEPLTLWRQHRNSYTATHYGNKQRTKNDKYNDWKEKLDWLKLLSEYELNPHKEFMQKIYHIYEKRNTTFSWSLFSDDDKVQKNTVCCMEAEMDQPNK